MFQVNIQEASQYLQIFLFLCSKLFFLICLRDVCLCEEENQYINFPWSDVSQQYLICNITTVLRELTHINMWLPLFSSYLRGFFPGTAVNILLEVLWASVSCENQISYLTCFLLVSCNSTTTLLLIDAVPMNKFKQPRV